MCNWNSSWQRRTGIGSGEWRRHERVHLATRRANSTAQRQVPEATQIRMILNRIAKAHPVSLDIPVSRAKRMVTNIVSPSLTQLMTGVFQGIRWAFAVRGGKNDMAITWPSHISPDCSVPRAPASLKLRGKLCNRILANFAPVGSARCSVVSAIFGPPPPQQTTGTDARSPHQTWRKCFGKTYFRSRSPTKTDWSGTGSAAQAACLRRLGGTSKVHTCGQVP